MARQEEQCSRAVGLRRCVIARGGVDGDRLANMLALEIRAQLLVVQVSSAARVSGGSASRSRVASIVAPPIIVCLKAAALSSFADSSCGSLPTLIYSWRTVWPTRSM